MSDDPKIVKLVYDSDVPTEGNIDGYLGAISDMREYLDKLERSVAAYRLMVKANSRRVLPNCDMTRTLPLQRIAHFK